MRYIYADIMIVCSIIAFFYATRVFYNKNHKKLTYRLFSLLSIVSGVWSLGYGMMFLQDSPKKFAPYRAMGIAGIIMFMICGQIVLSTLGGTLRKLWMLMVVEAAVGLYVFVTIIQPKNYTMINTPKGIITEFNSTGISLLYTLYTVFIAAVFVWISVAMTRRNNTKRIRAFGKAFLKVEGLIGLGMIVDTVLPAFGINPNIPASTIF